MLPPPYLTSRTCQLLLTLRLQCRLLQQAAHSRPGVILTIVAIVAIVPDQPTGDQHTWCCTWSPDTSLTPHSPVESSLLIPLTVTLTVETVPIRVLLIYNRTTAMAAYRGWPAGYLEREKDLKCQMDLWVNDACSSYTQYWHWYHTCC